MPKPVLAVLAPPDHAPILSATQWWAMLPGGHQYFAHPRPLSPVELAHLRQRYAPWLTNLQQHLREHPHDPHKESILDMIRQWAELRGLIIDHGQTEWPGIDYGGES